MVPVTVDVDGHQIAMQEGARSGGFDAADAAGRSAACRAAVAAAATETVPLVALAYGRSGDKGDNANIGIFARKPEYQPILDAEVTEEAVAKYFAHRIKGKVSRWRLPGINGFNFLLRQALGGGGMASLQGRSAGQGLRPDAARHAGAGAGGAGEEAGGLGSPETLIDQTRQRGWHSRSGGDLTARSTA